jgi:hypothetical protein
MTDQRAFSVTCRHCGAIVLQVPRIGDVEEQELAMHLKAIHPGANFHTPRLGRLFDHFIVRESGTA